MAAYRTPWLPLVLALFFTIACQQQPSDPEHHTGFITVADSKIYYETTGKGDPILLLHGGFLDRRMWDDQVAALAQQYEVITCDQRGHGATIDGDSNYYMHDALKKLLDTLNIKKASVIGLSMGSSVALEFALAHPGYIDKLILTVPGINRWGSLPPQDSLLVHNDSLMWKAAEIQKDTALAAEYFIRSWFDGPHRRPNEPDTAARAKALAMATTTMKDHRLKYWPRLSDSATIPRLHQLKMPLFLILGEKDNYVIRQVSDTILAHVPQAKRIYIQGVAHMPNMEKPEAYNAAVKGFLEKR